MKIRIYLFLGVVFFSLMSNSALAHEPIFSLGPETIFKGGFGIETEFEFDQADKDKEQALNTEVLYGLTESIGLTLRIPQFINQKEGVNVSNGVGDVSLRGKYQFYKKDSLGSQDKATLIYGLKFPSGNKNKTPSLGSGSVDHLFGLSVGHESTTFYGFATGRYLLKTDSDGKNKGDQFLFDFSVGFRPWIRPYKSWDLVMLLENSYVYTQKDEIARVRQGNTGGQKFFMGPSFLWSLRNIMLKGGIQFPVWQNLNGTQSKTDLRSVVGLEYHF